MPRLPRKRKRRDSDISCLGYIYAYSARRPMKTLVAIVCLVAVLQLVYVLVTFLGDTSCMGVQYQQFLCAKFREGEIVGDLCEKLCSYKIKLSSCLESEGDVQVFYSWTKLYKVSKQHYLSAVNGGIVKQESVFFEPLVETPLTQFYVDLAQFFEAKLGPGVYDKLVMRATQLVDHNKDGELSSAEAKTLWSLMQNNEFFILAIFHKEFNVAPVTGVCGNLYALDRPHTSYLYNRNRGFWGYILPESWFLPRWEHRAKIGYSIVELMYTLLEEPYGGMFHVCNWDETNLGYSFVNEVEVKDYSYVIPQKMLATIQGAKSCRANAQCAFGKYCHTTCNRTTERCTGQLERSTFAHVCSILKIYLLRNIPSDLKLRMERLLYDCARMKGGDYVQQALFANEFMTLLWPKILMLRS